MLHYVTSNKSKIEVAQKYLHPHGVIVSGSQLEFDEIQSSSIEIIARHKAAEAFRKLNKPLLVNDAGWYIPALNGFPGPYMKLANEWLTSNDFLNLMSGHSDRRIIFREVLYYVDSAISKPFISELEGTILDTDTSPDDLPSYSLISLSETGKSIADCRKTGVPSTENYRLWTDFAEWYKKNNIS